MSHECPICGNTETVYGQPFESQNSVVAHIAGSTNGDHKGVSYQEAVNMVDAGELQSTDTTDTDTDSGGGSVGFDTDTDTDDGNNGGETVDWRCPKCGTVEPDVDVDAVGEAGGWQCPDCKEVERV